MASPAVDIDRARVECVFGLCGGELHVADERFPDEWDGVIAYWYEGVPDYITLAELGLDFDDDVRTAILSGVYGLPAAPKGWRQVAWYTSSGEGSCWWCTGGAGDGTGNDAERSGCKLCEGDGTVYIGDGWAEVVYRRIG